MKVRQASRRRTADRTRTRLALQQLALQPRQRLVRFAFTSGHVQWSCPRRFGRRFYVVGVDLAKPGGADFNGLALRHLVTGGAPCP